jgi:hypothetical protein
MTGASEPDGGWMTDLLLEAVPDREPPIGDAVEDIFRRADAVRRREIRALLAAATLAVVGIIAVGYVLATLLLPATPQRRPTTAGIPSGRTDPVLEVIRPILQASALGVVAREPASDAGWRRYRVLSSNGRSRGVIEISAYAAPTRLCFPVHDHPGVCGRPELSAGGVAYARYVDDRDVNWQVNEVIARFPDGRVTVVQATGERGTGTATAGRPPLSALVAARIATDQRIATAFGAGDRCTAACPVLKVPVTLAGG